ncbi:M48 family metallopeptidase [Thermoflexus sp.]|uniref:M48 family metallopeptidase n=1 Tax=Thermoflexus sp. TaxID=1969742 RepID=UPI0025E9ECA9|nr:M48 family metallopeptidase [Thermoflexus sp.]MCS6963291.1 M48 family metallopeptidase [Thermoflexus sp.]
MDRQQEAKRYARLRRRLWLAETGLFLAYALLWLGSGLARWVGEALAQSLPFPLDAMGMAVLFGGGWALLSLPLDFYGGFLLPHRFGLSTQTRTGWLSDRLKGWGIGTLIGLPLLGGLYWAFRHWPQTWWMPVGLFWILFSVLIAQLAPVLLVPLFYRFRPLEDPELIARLTRLAAQAGVQVRGVFTIDMSRRTRAANAGLMGLGPTRRIVVGDTLLQGYAPEEIEAILAHELAHHLHRDIPLALVVGSLLNLIGFFLGAQILPRILQGLGLPGLDHPSSLPVLAVGAFLFSLGTMIPANAWSRWREWKADQEAIRLCGQPLALASALRKLGEQNLAELDPEPWVEWIFYTHPALGKRIRFAEAVAQRSASMQDMLN